MKYYNHTQTFLFQGFRRLAEAKDDDDDEEVSEETQEDDPTLISDLEAGEDSSSEDEDHGDSGPAAVGAVKV